MVKRARTPANRIRTSAPLQHERGEKTAHRPLPRLPRSAWRELLGQSGTPLRDLLEVALAAVDHESPWLVQSIFGRASTWTPPYWQYSELNVLNYWEPLESVRYLIAITVPSVDHAPNRFIRALVPPLARRLFWRPSFYYQQPDPFGSVTSYLDERWFFINGVATDPKVARMNTQLLSQLFQRPVTGVYNATNSLGLDLVQCAIGKRYKIDPDLEDLSTLTRPAFLATRAILERVIDPDVKAVVVIAHSQGTIIAANLLRAITTAIAATDALRRHEPIRNDMDALEEEACHCLIPLHPQNMTAGDCDDHFARLLGKLELYLFANCADRVNYAMTLKTAGGQVIGLPYLENFANEHDVIARLGVLSPLRNVEAGPIAIDGPVYVQTGDDAWGHFLNAHYLRPILGYLQDPAATANPYRAEVGPDTLPRLYQYYGGQRPADLE